MLGGHCNNSAVVAVAKSLISLRHLKHSSLRILLYKPFCLVCTKYITDYGNNHIKKSANSSGSVLEKNSFLCYHYIERL